MPPRTSTHPARGAILGLALLCLGGAAGADTLEDATRYTVKVRSATPVMFIEDESRGGTGSGFLVDRERGWVLTNGHVVGYAPSRVEVAFKDRGYHEARVRYLDTHLDLAVVAVPGDAIPGDALEAPYDCERRPRTGENVVAFGHPWGLDYTATRGIVSGVSTRWERQWIQTDAPLNSGNSGGPLISLRDGNVVGINAVILSGDEVQNLNFAVEMQQACTILELLREGVDPTPPRLPFTVASREHGDGGLVIARELTGNGNDLRPGDHILAVGDRGRPPANQTELYQELRGVDGSVRLTLARDGRELTRRVPLEPGRPVMEREGILVAGVLFAPVPRDLERAENGGRLMVQSTTPGTPGSVAGFGSFELLEAVNGRTVTTLDELRAILESTPADQDLRVVIRTLSNGNDWWTYSERLLPARPYETVARDR